MVEKFVVQHPCAVCHGTGVAKFFHGTKAELKVGDLIAPGRAANFGEPGRIANYIYFTGTLDAAAWGAELARGEGRGRIYVVEPIGEFHDDPNLTNMKFPGNPTRSYRSHEPLRIVSELLEWEGHSQEQIEAMKAGLAKLKAEGKATIDD